MDTLYSILWGIVGGVCIAISGWFKKHPRPDFDLRKFEQTVLVGAITGGIMGATGVGYDEASVWAESMGLTVLLEQLKKVLLRRTSFGKDI